MPGIYAVPAVRVVQFDGTNASEVVDVLNAEDFIEAELVGVVGGRLTVHATTYGGTSQGGGDDDIVVNVGDWVRPGGPVVIPAATFVQEWIVKAVAP